MTISEYVTGCASVADGMSAEEKAKLDAEQAAYVAKQNAWRDEILMDFPEVVRPYGQFVDWTRKVLFKLPNCRKFYAAMEGSLCAATLVYETRDDVMLTGRAFELVVAEAKRMY